MHIVLDHKKQLNNPENPENPVPSPAPPTHPPITHAPPLIAVTHAPDQACGRGWITTGRLRRLMLLSQSERATVHEKTWPTILSGLRGSVRAHSSATNHPCSHHPPPHTHPPHADELRATPRCHSGAHQAGAAHPREGKGHQADARCGSCWGQQDIGCSPRALWIGVLRG